MFVAWFETQNGLVAVKDMPQGFRRFVSVTGAKPGTLETKLVWANESGRAFCEMRNSPGKRSRERLRKLGENIMFNFDLRSFAPKNRDYFWQAAQNALTKIKIQNDRQNEGIEFLLTTLLDMHKRIKNGEDPMLLNDMRIIEPEPKEQLGPEW